MNRAITAATHIKSAMPALAPLVDALGPLELPRGRRTPLWDAVPKIIVGQMLSGHVADVIYTRVQKAAGSVGAQYPWMLADAQLRACGVSSRKIQTLRAFGVTLQTQPDIVSIWPELDYQELVNEVRKIWGLGEWSAAMLAIFHFEHEDIFPYSDGSLARALRFIQTNHTQPESRIDTDAASPFRSYLALYLWKALDQDYLKLNNHHITPNLPDSSPQ